MENELKILDERKEFIICKSSDKKGNVKCDQESIAGSVSQRACVYCGARVVLNPITDAIHIVHGPIGCASYTWDIRGSLSSGPSFYRNSFSTDLKENDVIFGGEKKLSQAIDEIVKEFKPKLIFVYSTCIVGIIGDDLDAVCKEAENKYGITVIPIQSSGFIGNKSMGYKAACNALMKIMKTFKKDKEEKVEGINILGDFNLAGEMWIITKYLKDIGVNIISKFTGDGRFDEIKNASNATLNIVQCAGSMTFLAREMEKEFNIPYIKVSFVGLEDTKRSLIDIVRHFKDKIEVEKAKEYIDNEIKKVLPSLEMYKDKLKGKKAAIYVGGGFKAISLIRQFRNLGVETVIVGTQTGKKDEYEVIESITPDGTVILDDTNPTELEKFIKEKKADILVGGVKERPLAYKLGVAFCDHNHERKHPLCGFEGAVNFAQEIDLTVNSPVWKYLR
ncbi:MAG: nitrogenase iron-molybdenum cofactor biosynthesis protein NifE [Clostridiales bacterium]